MTNKRLIKEIEQWRGEGLITDDASQILKKRYSTGSRGTLAIVFSVIGSALIVAGIILLFAKNWHIMPLAVKGTLSFLPLIAGQAIAMFTLIKKRDSLPWREGAAIFLTGAVFATLGLTDQSFQLEISSGTYMLSCALLTLPVIYILDAVSPLAVYFGALLSWGFMHESYSAAPVVVTLLLAAGIAYVVIHRRESQPRRTLSVWICAVTGGVYTVFLLMSVLDSDVNVAAVLAAYFLILYAASSPESDNSLPFKPMGALGSAVAAIVSIIISSSMYVPEEQRIKLSEYVTLIAALLALAAAVITAIIRKRNDACALLYVLACGAACALCCITPTFVQSSFIIFVAAVLALAAGVCLTVKGSRESEMPTVNLGLLLICAIIAMSFFELETDLFVKGIAFLILGAMFLAANLLMLKSKKSRGERSDSQ